MDKILFIIAAAVVVYLFAVFVALIPAINDCLRAGYPKAELDFWLNPYCIKRVDQTDVVKPLREVRK